MGGRPGNSISHTLAVMRWQGLIQDVSRRVNCTGGTRVAKETFRALVATMMTDEIGTEKKKKKKD